ncbi:hypothetical protein, partial [Staphylococcus sp. GDY8P64P]|uniref:hypothetical protein n=1 Tax=Staphylococcus sp. GDY8P64P TaxID=2804423 RepID=UPI00194EDE50
MAGLIRTSQVVASQQGNLIWMAVIRTEQHQNRYQPLQAYMNQESIQHHMLPWQQIIMFFAHTQMEPTEETPGYQFTWRQQKTWEILWEQAKHTELGGAPPYQAPRYQAPI